MRIFGASIPKSGTHFLTGIFREMGFSTLACRKVVDGNRRRMVLPEAALGAGAGDVYAYGHWRAKRESARQLADAGYAVLVLIRDPRDICLSMADFLKAGLPADVHKRVPELRHQPLREIIAGCIRGYRLDAFKQPGIRETCEGWLDWRRHGAVVLRYEDASAAVAERRTLPDLAGLGLDPDRFLAASVRCYRAASSSTMNKGVSFRWRSEFDDDLRDLWRREAAGVAAALGYEEV